MTDAKRPNYFPDETLGKNQEEHNFRVSWYSACLTAMEEPSVWEMSSDRESHVYRFLLLPSFDSPAVGVRLSVRKDGTAGLISTVTGPSMLGHPSAPINKKTEHLTKEQTNTFLGIVQKTRFWNEPHLEPHLDNRVELDGEQWILEGVRNGEYHIVDRWSPEKGVCLELGRHLMFDLAELQLDE